MTPEQFNPQDYLPFGHYAWPNDVNPHIEQMGEDQALWIDTDYTYLSEEHRKKYKRMNLHYCIGRMYPYASYEGVTPCSRFVLFQTAFDDSLEFLTKEEVCRYGERLVTIFKGAQPTPEEHGLFRQAAIIRNEYRAVMPDEWLERFIEGFIEGFHRVTKYGAAEEMPYKNSGTVPSLAYFQILREYSVLCIPYLYMVDVEFNSVLPKDIDEHPVIQRLRVLVSRLVGWQNDFHSLMKELRMNSETMNLIIVLQRKCNLSLKDALTEAMKINDADLAEFDALRADLPDFGLHHKQVEQFIFGLGVMLQGLNSFYYQNTRYASDGSGFPWPAREQTVNHS
ncbi:terpene synthase family protein [Parapedobacter tibetensis]|uniref:terpene synthase family protein n=1 Tax=Parapedobacter tibetensis TaxID=2972951 RepID=UPI00214D705E|nr:terpene synthase family protein [Parapedobacter tibetensis]